MENDDGNQASVSFLSKVEELIDNKLASFSDIRCVQKSEFVFNRKGNEKQF